MHYLYAYTYISYMNTIFNCKGKNTMKMKKIIGLDHKGFLLYQDTNQSSLPKTGLTAVFTMQKLLGATLGSLLKLFN